LFGLLTSLGGCIVLKALGSLASRLRDIAAQRAPSVPLHRRRRWLTPRYRRGNRDAQWACPSIAAIVQWKLKSILWPVWATITLPTRWRCGLC
jgi:hypothetical protein